MYPNTQSAANPQMPAVTDLQNYGELRKFDHTYNVQLAIQNCTARAGDPKAYALAVEHFELMVVTEEDETIRKKLEAIDKQYYDKYGEEWQNITYQYQIARQKFRILYAYTKRKSPIKAILAIGRPKCHNCGEQILWNRDERAQWRKEHGKSEPANATPAADD